MNKEKALKNQGLEFREDIKNEGRNKNGKMGRESYSGRQYRA